MTVPTRFIEEEEFTELMKQEGDIIPLFKLTAHPFDPPTGEPAGHKHDIVAMNVMLMNVSEPCIYKDKSANMAFVIMNAYDEAGTFNYENFQDCHIVKGAWFYRLSPSYWEEGDSDYDLSDAIYRFNHGVVPADWSLGN